MSGEPDFDDGVVFSQASPHDGTIDDIEGLVAAMTVAVVPWLNEDPDQLHVRQGLLITASALMAGRIAGHLQGIGAINRASAKQIERTIAVNFRSGKKVGLGEVARAMKGQAQ